jgi:glycosyltransferase involved in cell wall biosynthesis
MKILYVIHDFLPKHQAGAEIYTYLLAKELSKKHEILLLFTEIAPLSKTYTIKKRTVNDLQCVEVFRPPETDLAEAPYNDKIMEEIFTNILAEFKPEIIHLQHLLYHSLRYPEIAKRHKIPVLFTLHDYWLTCPRWGQRLRKNLEICYNVDFQKCADCIYELPANSNKLSLSSLYNLLRQKPTRSRTTQEKTVSLIERYSQALLTVDKVDLFIAPSPFLREMFINFGIPEDKIIISDNGFDTRGYTKKERRIVPPIRFGYIGTINEHKGVHVLVEAFNEIPKEKAELHIYGDLTWFPEYSAKLKRMATSPAISFKGVIAHNFVATVLADIDILVVPSIWFENSPLTIHEAFMAGVPVIASNIGGMADLITDRTNGLLFKVNDACSLSSVMRELIESDTLPDHLCKEIPPVKSIQENGLELEQIYNQLRA